MAEPYRRGLDKRLCDYDCAVGNRSNNRWLQEEKVMRQGRVEKKFVDGLPTWEAQWYIDGKFIDSHYCMTEAEAWSAVDAFIFGEI